MPYRSPYASQMTDYPIYSAEQNNESESTITVEGIGKVSTEPDVSRITLGVVTRNEDIQAAQKENKEKMNKVLDSLRKNGIKEEDIKTINYNIFPRYDYIDGKQVLREYEVTNQIQIRILDINKIGKIIEDAVNNGVNSMHSINFTVSNPQKYYQEALQRAVYSSKIKAENIADTLRTAINPQPIKVTEITDSYSQPSQRFTVRENVPIESGIIEIIAKVETVFEML